MGPRKRIVIAATALSLLLGPLAFADPPHDWGHDRDHHGAWHGHHEEHRAHYRFNDGHYIRPHGYYVHRWHRGERLPVAFRAPVYVVPNVAVYHLRPPPPGYYWVRVDNNAVLAAIATGVVVDVAYNLFH